MIMILEVFLGHGQPKLPANLSGGKITALAKNQPHHGWKVLRNSGHFPVDPIQVQPMWKCRKFLANSRHFPAYQFYPSKVYVKISSAEFFCTANYSSVADHFDPNLINFSIVWRFHRCVFSNVSSNSIQV